MNDGGLPFNLEPNILEDMISPPNILTQAQNLVFISFYILKNEYLI
jgi:hypothetical protein